jgi:hypothetical protein
MRSRDENILAFSFEVKASPNFLYGLTGGYAKISLVYKKSVKRGIQ